jgi:hypothetical protein
MICYSRLLKLMTLMFLCAALSLSAMAQKRGDAKPTRRDSGEKGGKIIEEKRPNAVNPSLEIFEVRKNQAGAKAAPDGKGFIVPFVVRVGIVLPDTAKLKLMEMELVTKNTDGSTTPAKVMVPLESLRGNQIIHEIKLPMPNGVFAKSFNLKVTAKIIDEISRTEIMRTATKSGSFAVER